MDEPDETEFEQDAFAFGDPVAPKRGPKGKARPDPNSSEARRDCMAIQVQLLRAREALSARFPNDISIHLNMRGDRGAAWLVGPEGYRYSADDGAGVGIRMVDGQIQVSALARRGALKNPEDANAGTPRKPIGCWLAKDIAEAVDVVEAKTFVPVFSPEQQFATYPTRPPLNAPAQAPVVVGPGVS